MWKKKYFIFKKITNLLKMKTNLKKKVSKTFFTKFKSENLGAENVTNVIVELLSSFRICSQSSTQHIKGTFSLCLIRKYC